MFVFIRDKQFYQCLPPTSFLKLSSYLLTKLKQEFSKFGINLLFGSQFEFKCLRELYQTLGIQIIQTIFLRIFKQELLKLFITQLEFK